VPRWRRDEEALCRAWIRADAQQSGARCACPAAPKVLPNEAGIAPGFLVRMAGHAVYFLPGIPRRWSGSISTMVAPRLRAHMAAQGVPGAAVRTWHVYGDGQSHIDHA